MKKRNLKSLRLTKKTISSFNQKLNGGAAQSGFLSCKPAEPEPVTQLGETGCADTRINWCDSRFGGCPSYYCPR